MFVIKFSYIHPIFPVFCIELHSYDKQKSDELAIADFII